MPTQIFGTKQAVWAGFGGIASLWFRHVREAAEVYVQFGGGVCCVEEEWFWGFCGPLSQQPVSFFSDFREMAVQRDLEPKIFVELQGLV
jgi:hypothetical protein